MAEVSTETSKGAEFFDDGSSGDGNEHAKGEC